MKVLKKHVLIVALLIGALFFVGGNASAAVNNAFIKPTEGVLTQGFKKGVHNGVDIAKRGYVKVVASASGTVSRSEYSQSYGHVIYIKHNIRGVNYETVYAHLSRRNVKVGDKVYQGQMIGLMGNTGNSKGQHLHFEIHQPSWNGSKSYALNPMNYISNREGKFKSGNFTYQDGTEDILVYPISYGSNTDLTLNITSKSATKGEYTVYLQRKINNKWENVAHSGVPKNGSRSITFTREYNTSTLYQYTPYRVLLVNSDTTNVSYSLWIK
ncbi:M23 family metallopeptidase [Siminovitchia sp. FSL W7-1587]|uniref:M23 family metallopeptidase n=1 Tax=Siminovitchia sp. FSL W7-1587 TaxID=2954699 RepID=UPI0030D1EE43